MAADVFSVQDSTISADALAVELTRTHAFSRAPICRFFRKGICDTYRVVDEEKSYFLKVYKHGYRTFIDVAEEVRLLLHLASDGVSVAEPVMRTDGLYVGELRAPEGDRFWVLYREAVGDRGAGGDPSRLRALGQTVARMHRSSDTLHMPYRRTHLDLTHLVDERLEVIAPFMAHRASDVRLLDAVASECRQLAVFSDASQPTFGVCHGDLHGGDVAYDPERVPTLFDFDSSGMGWRSIDLGVFPASIDWMDTSSEAEAKRDQQLSAFLDGYHGVRQLTRDELHAVRQTAPIRHIYLMGFVLRHTTRTRGDHWANDSFIDWHMQWFRWWANAHAGA